jgi:hypothetical protein
MNQLFDLLGWIPWYLEDIESDMSAFHRIGDIYTLDSRVFFARVLRLFHYEGAVRARAAQEIKEEYDEAGEIQEVPMSPTVEVARAHLSAPLMTAGVDTIPDSKTAAWRRAHLYSEAPA